MGRDRSGCSRFRKPLEAAVGAVDPAERDADPYVHGGGFELGGGDTYAGFAGWLAEATGADVYMPDYRLAPEHPQPAPTDDVFAAYRAVSSSATIRSGSRSSATPPAARWRSRRSARCARWACRRRRRWS